MPLKHGSYFAIASPLLFLLCPCISGFNNGLKMVSMEDRKVLFSEKETSNFGDILVSRVSDIVLNLAKELEAFNDQRFRNTSVADWLHYDDMKPTLDDAYIVEGKSSVGRNVKKMGMAMMPLVFHAGATSTWMLITALMTFKSVALMLILLVFKIAVSAAKVSSFFTHHYGHKEHITWATPHHGYTPHEHEHNDGWARSKALAVSGEGPEYYGAYSQPYPTGPRIEVEELDVKKNLLKV